MSKEMIINFYFIINSNCIRDSNYWIWTFSLTLWEIVYNNNECFENFIHIYNFKLYNLIPRILIFKIKNHKLLYYLINFKH